MILHHYPSSTCSQKVRLVLAEKGAQWDSTVVDLQRGAQFEPAYLALNPAGVVPTLVVGTQVLRESSVINEYLEDTIDAPPLMPRDAFLRARVRLWIRRLDDEIHPACGVLTFAATAAQRRARIEAQGSTVAAYLAQVPDEARRKRQQEVLEHGAAAESVRRALGVHTTLFRDMDAALQDSNWLVGPGCTLADLAYVPYVLRSLNLGLDVHLGLPVRVQDWMQRMRERNSYATAVSAWSDEKQEATMREAGLAAWR